MYFVFKYNFISILPIPIYIYLLKCKTTEDRIMNNIRNKTFLKVKIIYFTTYIFSYIMCTPCTDLNIEIH